VFQEEGSILWEMIAEAIISEKFIRTYVLFSMVGKVPLSSLPTT
jgi:hypothetical protein